MARPTNFSLRIIAEVLAEFERNNPSPPEPRTCPFTANLPWQKRLTCSDCHGVTCARLKKLGLGDDGEPLPHAERPCCGAITRQLFACGNIRLPAGVDRVLRWVMVTPDMHRVHHSVIPAETNSNFGFNLPWWDRLLGTYRAQPKAGHEGMTIGIKQFRTPRDLWLDRMLIQPLRGPASGGALDTRPVDRG